MVRAGSLLTTSWASRLRRRLAGSERQISESVDGLDPQHRAVRRRAARAQLRRDVQIAVRTLLHVADANAELTQQRLSAFGLRRAVAFGPGGVNATRWTFCPFNAPTNMLPFQPGNLSPV